MHVRTPGPTPTARRPRLRMRAAGVVVLLALISLAGCGDDQPSSAGTPSAAGSSGAQMSSSASQSPTQTSNAIPDGDYSRVATTSDARQLGMSAAMTREMLGAGGRTTFTLRFAGRRWTQFEDAGTGPELGDLGSLAYDGEGNLVTTSNSGGCPGCVYTYGWKLKDDQLTLTVLDHHSPDTPQELLGVRLVTEGTFSKKS